MARHAPRRMIAERDVTAGPCSTPEAMRSPLRHLPTDAVSAAARAETRNREIHLPPVTAYRWWARRTESINGAILDALALDRSGRLLVVDPFAGGGVIPLASVIRGCRTYAQDLNPWAVSGLVGMLNLPAASDLEPAGLRLAELAKPLLAKAYGTKFSDGEPAFISHTFRVATAKCPNCRTRQRLFPHALVSLITRRESGESGAFLACPLGHLFVGVETGVQTCPECERPTDPTAGYTAQRLVSCLNCGAKNKLETLATKGNWEWTPVLVERVKGRSRELAVPTIAEKRQAKDSRWPTEIELGEIPAGQETHVLLRHGFKTWNDIYPARQRHLIEELLKLADEASDSAATVLGLRLAIIGSVEMAGNLSRWDRYYLKSYESMAGHRFNFTTFAAEPNVWGNQGAGRGSVLRRLASFAKGSQWLRDHGASTLGVEGPMAAADGRTAMPATVDVRVVEGSSERMLLLDGVADICLTDPPYHDDVQYDELSLPFRAWAKQSIDRLQGEAVANARTGQNTVADDYQGLLTRIFAEAHRTLKRDGHLIFSYANREPKAWTAVLGALNTAGFKAIGFAILHSENETDVVKRSVRACTLDLLMDLVPAECPNVERWTPSGFPASDEGDFLAVVGEAFMKVGELQDGALASLEKRIGACRFLTQAKALLDGGDRNAPRLGPPPGTPSSS
jgi:putative DNA methylase